MKSADYLHDILKESPHEGYLIQGKRYSLCAERRDDKWMYAVCRMRYCSVLTVTELFETKEEAWEDFLSRKHPNTLRKWRAREAEAE